jgi:hypothetical protein
MRTYLTLLTIGLAWPARVLGGYGIHESCKDWAFIKESVDAAIDMADKADAAIGDFENPNRDPNVQRLLGLLFGNDLSETDLKGIKKRRRRLRQAHRQRRCCRQSGEFFCRPCSTNARC